MAEPGNGPGVRGEQRPKSVRAWKCGDVTGCLLLTHPLQPGVGMVDVGRLPGGTYYAAGERGRTRFPTADQRRTNQQGASAAPCS